MIQAEALSKSYRVHLKEPGLKGSLRSLFVRKWHTVDAVRKVDLRVRAGEILGLVGANGAGKTTLVKMLTGIIHPSQGSARVLGQVPWERNNAFRRRIALIMGQKAQLWWDLPAGDCFLLLREIYQVPRARFTENLRFLTEALEVEPLMKIQIRRLSLGERMKMELIAALLHDPSVVFLDEPTIGLDLTAQRTIRRFILDYRKQHECAIVLTSHYMQDIQELCPRVAIIKNGEIVYDGQLARIQNEYAGYKILTLKLPGEARPSGTAREQTDDTPELLPPELGELQSFEGGTARLKVQREMAARATSTLLARFPGADLNIEEEDIGTLIEDIMRGRAR